MRRTVLLLALLLALAPVRATTAGSVPPRLREMLLVLEHRLVNVDFENEPLAGVLRFFRTWTGVNLIESPVLRAERGPAELRVTLTLTKVSVKTALEIILDLKGLAAVYRHGVIMITTPKDARGKPVLRLYNISDLTFRIRDFPAPDLMLRPAGSEDFGKIAAPEEEGREHAFADPETILDLVRDNCGAGTWEDEGVSANVFGRFLVVRQYRAVHREIGNLLDLLRAYR